MTKTVLLDLTSLRTASRVRGIGRYTADLARGLAELSSHEQSPRMLYLEDISRTGAAEVSEDATGAVSRLMDPSRTEWSQPRRHRRLRRAYPRLLKGLKPQLVHLPEPRVIPQSVPGVKRLVTCHDLIPHHFPDEYLRGLGRKNRTLAQDRRRYQSADHVLCISRATANDVQQLMLVPQESCSVVHHGVRAPVEGETKDVSALLKEFSVQGPYFLFVGDADFRKNADGMCAALGQLSAPVPLVWVGRLAPSRKAQIEELAARTGARVVFAGFVDDATLAGLYSQATATLFISRYEGFGYPVLEAMNNSCPVITSTTSSLPEVAGQAALLADPERPSSIAEAMRRLLEEEGLSERLKEAGLIQAGGFTPEKMAQETMQLYRRLLSADS